MRYCSLLLLIVPTVVFPQSDFSKDYENFNQQITKFQSYREENNQKYADFLRSVWEWYDGKAPIPLPKDETPVPPKPYVDNDIEPVTISPVDVEPIAPIPQPKPVEPIREVPTPDDEYFIVDFYGAECKVRLPECARLRLKDCQNSSIADGWERLSKDAMNNAIRDCLETRIRYHLCDWAYLMLLDKIGKQYCVDNNGGTLLTAFLYCQSGYQMRLAVDGNRLVMLYGSRHQIYDKGYYNVDGTQYYPLGETSRSISICGAAFDGETPMSLLIDKEQLLGQEMTAIRAIQSERYKEVVAGSQVPQRLIEFYNEYPTSALNDNPMTRWAMYANTPLAQKTRECLYPSLKSAVDGLSGVEAAQRLLNWVQTGFVYEYDDKVWGHDRAFFAEEFYGAAVNDQGKSEECHIQDDQLSCQ